MTSKWNELGNTISLSDIVGLIDYFGKRKKKKTNKQNKKAKDKYEKVTGVISERWNYISYFHKIRVKRTPRCADK